MLVLGIDLGTSSIKVTVVDTSTHEALASAHYPETEADIISLQPGWAEQSPDQWWENVKQAILKCHATNLYDPQDIQAIGIAYQMHGLVLVDREQQVLRNSIIWCDSRAVAIGDEAFIAIGRKRSLSHLLNSPGNFTASKLAWVKQNEPEIYKRIDKVLLPGDFIAMKLTGECTTTSSALSEGIFWDFQQNQISEDILSYFHFDPLLFPPIHPLFGNHGYLKATVAARLSLRTGIPISYKSGDQPNNALSLNVMQSGEVAATAGTSGVIYGVTDALHYDLQSRVNSFAHVNHEENKKRIGILLCINGVGSFYRWIRNVFGSNFSYGALNEAASQVPAGAEGLFASPFGNGAERMLNNKIVGGHFYGLDFNLHTTAHIARAAQEGIAFAFRFGLDIMRENGIQPTVIRASKSNLFLSPVFTDSFVNTTNVSVEFYEGDGSFGAAIGASIGARMSSEADILVHRKPLLVRDPGDPALYDELYTQWRNLLEEQLQNTGSTVTGPLMTM
jgi:xylulokinase